VNSFQAAQKTRDGVRGFWPPGRVFAARDFPEGRCRTLGEVLREESPLHAEYASVDAGTNYSPVHQICVTSEKVRAVSASRSTIGSP
jgi:hypothetical protein